MEREEKLKALDAAIAKLEKETAKVLIDFLGNQTPMEIDLVALEKTF